MASTPRRLPATHRIPAVFAAIVIALTAIVIPGSTSSVEAACGSFQSLVDGAPSGGSVTIPACTYSEIVEVRKALTINAYGATIDGGNSRSYGLKVLASDVTVNGLTVTRVRGGEHVGAVWTTGVSRFTFRDGVARDSSTVCVSLNGGSGHRVIDSELTGCGKEGYFGNGLTDVLFQGNRIHHNNTSLGYDPQSEAGGGKVMASQDIRFINNEVDHNGGPGIWFDNGVSDVTVRGNRSHDNHESGIMFEISSGASITDNAVWNNGFGHAAWGFGAGILISSSDGAKISGNTVAWNARGISVISQSRNLSPHTGNVISDNVIVSKGGSFVAGFYDDHGGSLFSSSNGNHGSGNRYWIGTSEPSGDRFQWSGPKSTLSSYNGTPGDEDATYLTNGQRDSILSGHGMPTGGTSTVPTNPAPDPDPEPEPDPDPEPDPEPAPSAPKPVANKPVFSLRIGRHGTNDTVPARLAWSATDGADRYQLQLKRVTGEYVAVPLSNPKAHAKSIVLLVGKDYRARVRVKVDGRWSAWATSPIVAVGRSQETSSRITWEGAWKRKASATASGGHVRAISSDDAKAAFTFTGRAVAWVAPKSATRGSAEVWVDGSLRKTVSLRRSTSLARAVVFTASWSGSGEHTVEIRTLGTDGHPRVDVDAFIVVR